MRLPNYVQRFAAILIISSTISIIGGLPVLAASTNIQSVISNGTPVITSPTPVSSPGTGTTPPTSTTTAASATITGSATPNTTLTVLDNGKVIASTTANASGSFSVAVPLSTGRNTITVRTSSGQGTTTPSTVSKPIVIIRKATLLQNIQKVSFFAAGSIAGLMIAALIVLQILGLLRRRRKRIA